MSGVDGSAYAEFFTRWYPRMVGIGLRAGVGRPDAEDAAGAVAMSVWRSWSRWIAVENKSAYLRTAVVNELGRTLKKQAARRAGERRWARDRWPEPRDSAADAHDRGRELEGVRECLDISPQRQREVLAWLCLRQRAGWPVAEVAEALGIRPATVRCQRRHARRSLEPFLLGEGHEHRRWLRAGQRIHESFAGGDTGLSMPRPVIGDAWTLLRDGGLTPDRGTRVELLDQDELAWRRHRSPIPVDSPILAELVDLATRNELLAVVLDSRLTVLHRGGHRDALAAADRLGFVDGACWDLAHAGVTAAGLAGHLGAPVAVNRWEHYFPDQHGMCCVAIPVPTPDGGHVTINLTSTADSLTTVPLALHRMLDILALRLRKQLPATGRGLMSEDSSGGVD